MKDIHFFRANSIVFMNKSLRDKHSSLSHPLSRYLTQHV
jgi:hypothetical protein